ncbi:medium-chain acyl-CoA ligase ACSF2, mitochondrial [Culicoides brevitarsis]|uniref:medium-chain acyl-CoA ligase ACSF2, mitochondrial n=1 Tax=Culicoides brevitarsis TaxID=469753 RepID=UPI00307C2203
MVDVARQLLDELMGRNRNEDPSAVKQITWEDSVFCTFYLVKFCPHDLFVNTRVDLGQCARLHDDEAKRLFEDAKPSFKKTQYEDEFLRFCTNMLTDVDRRIQKGKQRLLLMNSKLEQNNAGAPVKPITKAQEQLNSLTDKINKLVREAEEAGTRGDVDQAQALMRVCDELKEEKEQITKTQESMGWNAAELAAAQEKQMEVCEVCGAFLIIGDVQQRIDDHLSGKQHLGYLQLKRAVEEMQEARRKEREEARKRREEERRSLDKDRDKERRDRDKRRSGSERDRKSHGYSRRSRSKSRDRKRSNSKYSSPPHHRSDRDRRSSHHSRRSRTKLRIAVDIRKLNVLLATQRNFSAVTTVLNAPHTQNGPKLSYFHHVGSSPLIFRTVGQQLQMSADLYPNRECIVSCHEGKRYTFPEILEKADRLAASFDNLGIGKGDRVGLISPNYTMWYITAMACARSGCILVGLNPAYQVPELEYCVEKVGMKAIVAPETFKSQNYYEMIGKIVPEMLETGVEKKIQSKKHPKLETVIIESNRKLFGAHSFEDLLRAPSQQEISHIALFQHLIQPDSCCNIQFTSGTTGKPKAAMLSHYNFINNGFHIGKNQEFDKDYHRICVQVPLFHAFGVVIGVMAALVHGATLVLPSPGYKAEESIKAIKHEQCSYIYGTPTMYVDVVAKLKEQREHLDSLRMAVIGGSPCSPKLLKDMEEYLGVEKVKSVFGMTETTAVIFQSLRDEDKKRVLDYVGHVQEHTEAKVIDQDGNVVEFGKPGELCVRTYGTMLGYYGDEEKTKEMIGPDRWLKTGDQFVLHEDGYGQIVGRLKEMIIRGGENIFPKEIEDFLNHQPGILETHVVGIPDERMGEEVAAFIRLAPGKETITRDEVKEMCKGKLAHFKIPKYVYAVKEFPKTTSGKIQKFKCREMAQNLNKN